MTAVPAAATLGIAASFGLAATFARLAFASGVNVISLTTARTVFALLALGILLRLQRAALLPPAEERRAAWALGLVLAVQVYCLYKAVELMPVALAITVYYTYPVMVVIGGALFDRVRIESAAALAAILAGAGIVLMLSADPLAGPSAGIAFALVAAAGFATLLGSSTRLFRSRDSRPRTLAMLSAATPLFAAAALASGEFELPATSTGQAALLGVLVFYTIGFVGVFWSTARLGSAKTAVLLNFEPVAAVFFGTVILGEMLNAVQLSGIAVVLVALVLASRRMAAR